MLKNKSVGGSGATVCTSAAAAFLFFIIAVAGQMTTTEIQPEFLEPLENFTATQGRDVVFTCVVNHLGQYKVAWIKSDSKAILAFHTRLVAHNTRLSVTHNGHNTWKLHISNVHKNDSGTYMCQINTDPMRSQSGYLDVVVPPDIMNDESSDGAEALEGGTIRLRCRATGIPEPTVSWRREDSKKIIIRQEGSKEKSTVKAESIVNGEVLTLYDVQRTDMGVYLCYATNGVPPTVSKRHMVKVHFVPVIKVTNQLVASPLGSDVTVQCYVEASPASMTSWYREKGEKLVQSNKYHMTEVPVSEYAVVMNMTVLYMDKDDVGGYICSAANALGTSTGVVRLQELFDPRTTREPVHIKQHHKPTPPPRKPKVKPKYGPSAVETTTAFLMQTITTSTSRPPWWSGVEPAQAGQSTRCLLTSLPIFFSIFSIAIS